MLSHTLSLSWHCFRAGFMQAFVDKILFVGLFLVYATIMLLYSGVIKMIPHDVLAPLGLTKTQMIWYLGTTELILFTGSNWCFKDVQNDFLTGQADLAIVRPYPDSLLRVALWMGQSVSRALVLFFPYFLLMIALTGAIIPTVWDILGMFLSIPLGMFIMMAASYMIGASCLWFVQAEPASWVWQKSIFLFGAMIWPVIFYPVWLHALVWFTPFPAVLMLAGNWMLPLGPTDYILGFVHQMLWAIAFFKITLWLDLRILRRVQEGGV